MGEIQFKFPGILKELRLEEKLTQEDMSNLLQIDRSNIANYERGKRLPSIESLIKIADYFNVSLDYLIRGKDHKTSLDSSDSAVNESLRELMAENTSLMDNQLKMNDLLVQKEEEIRVLKDYLQSLKMYNHFLEQKIKLLENNSEEQ
ncbi:MAG: helix-turn-helix domain-containing protein [Cytophagaceae bacterium]